MQPVLNLSVNATLKLASEKRKRFTTFFSTCSYRLIGKYTYREIALAVRMRDYTIYSTMNTYLYAMSNIM